MITCSLDGRVLFWDIDQVEAVGCLQEPGVRYLCAAASPSGRYVACGTDEGFVFLFDLAESAKVLNLKHLYLAVIQIVRFKSTFFD